MFGLIRREMSARDADAIIDRYGAVLGRDAPKPRPLSDLLDPKPRIEEAILLALKAERDAKQGDVLAAAYLCLSTFQEMTSEEADGVRAFHMLKAMAARADEETLVQMLPAMTAASELIRRVSELENAEHQVRKRAIQPFAEKLGFEKCQ